MSCDLSLKFSSMKFIGDTHLILHISISHIQQHITIDLTSPEGYI